MALRLLGAVAALLIAMFAVRRYGKGELRRGELLVIFAVVVALTLAAVVPQVFVPFLSPLGFKPGDQRQIIGLLVISNLLTFALLFRGFSRDDLLSDEIGTMVDYIALRRLEDEGLPAGRSTCAVVIAAYNEADNLPAVLGEMPLEVEGLPTMPIVISDGSTDATEATARNLGATVIRRDLRRGHGAAMRLGCRVALKTGARVIVTMDADGQHDPKEMERLVKPLLAGDADIVQGSRVLGSFEGESNVRTFGVRFFARLLSILGRTKITDPSNGYRAFTPATFHRLDLRQDQYYVSELFLDATRKGYEAVEVPISVRKRVSGTTKKGKTVRYAWGFSKAIIRTWLR
ncbi:MAG: DUF2304 family protein [Actinobacteria bacterium]|nr:DUF2304 family protein [Actinomycetota bacterium]